MKQLLFLLTVFVFLCSCAEGVTAVPVAAQVPGWRTAGLESPQRGEGDTQWVNVQAAGTRLVAMNSVGQLWVSAGYSSGWARVSWSNPGTPYSIRTDNDSLWVGTEKPSRLYNARIGEWHWKDLKIPVPDTAPITIVGRFKGRTLAVGAAYRQDYVLLQDGEKWTDWGQGKTGSSPFRLLEVGDTLWAGTWESGLWYRVWGEASWKYQKAAARTSFVPGTARNDTTRFIRGLAWHRGSLWTADWGGETTEMPGGKAPYIAARNCPPDSSGAACLRDLPVNLLTMISWKDRLIAAGFFGSSGHVFDDSSRHWIPLEDSWCWNDYVDCGGTRTYDLVGLGDTVYAATNRFIMKFPVSLLPKMSPALEARYHWPTDTSWKNKYLYVKNPPHQ